MHYSYTEIHSCCTHIHTDYCPELCGCICALLWPSPVSVTPSTEVRRPTSEHTPCPRLRSNTLGVSFLGPRTVPTYTFLTLTLLTIFSRLYVYLVSYRHAAHPSGAPPPPVHLQRLTAVGHGQRHRCRFGYWKRKSRQPPCTTPVLRTRLAPACMYGWAR